MQHATILLCLAGAVVGFGLDRASSSGGRIVGGSDTDITKYPYQGYPYSVRVGSSLRNEGGKVYEIAQFILHELYDGFDYDIALLRLAEPIPFSATAQPMGLAAKGEEVAAGTPAVVTGWGLLEENGPSPSVLQEVEVPIISNSDCSKVYSVVTERVICAGYSTGGRDACQNDSGGPLVANGKQVGVVSFGNGCARPNNPGGYARVAALRDWIEENSGV